MKRICIIDIAGLSPRLLANSALAELWINHLPQRPRPLRPTFPAVSASVQASMTTGVEPGAHGVIAGGLFRRQSCQLSLEERSNTLLNKKRFWHSRKLPARPKTALVMWTNPLAGAADYVVGAMTYGPGGASLSDQPSGLCAELSQAVGACNLSLLRGPGSSWAASAWIAAAAEELWRRYQPDLQWVYLPGVNFEMVRHGVDSAVAIESARVLDFLARRLAQAVQAGGGEAVIVSDGAYVPVSRVAFPNVRLRQAGLLKVLKTDLGELVDFENSHAFAMVDHQVAHLYCREESAASEAAAIVAADPAVWQVVHRDDAFDCGLGHDRAGERVAMACGDAWMSYRWWADDAQAPRLAGRWDVQGKCGYDPCELFAPTGPAASDGGAIDPNPWRVRASRGLIPPDAGDHGVLAATCRLPVSDGAKVTDLPELLRQMMF